VKCYARSRQRRISAMSCYKIRMHCNLCSRANYLPSRRRVLSLSTPSAPALIPPPPPALTWCCFQCKHKCSGDFAHERPRETSSPTATERCLHAYKVTNIMGHRHFTESRIVQKCRRPSMVTKCPAKGSTGITWLFISMVTLQRQLKLGCH